MLIFDRSCYFAFCVVALCGAPAYALDVNPQPDGSAAPIASFKSVTDALKAGVQGLNAGDKPGAVRALQFAATKGNVAAQWKLGRMFAAGDGVAQDDYKAFQYFTQIASAHADEALGSPMSGVVAKAFVQLGSYHLDGIPNSPVRVNKSRAYEMFHYAASYYGDPDAQYNVGRMYLDGALGDKDVKQASRWLNLSAEKGHRYAQAVLGQILFNGQDVPRQRPLGLSWMQVAKDAADPVKEFWIIELFQKANSASSDDERKLSLFYARKHPRSASAASVTAEAAPR